MSLLSRFAMLEEEVMTEISSSGKETESKSAEDTKWIEKSKHSFSSPMKGDIKHRETVLKKIDKSRLVWAPCNNIKGGNSYLFAKLCDPSEIVCDCTIEWPIPEDSVVVEYIAIPVNFPQFAVVKNNSIHRYDEPMKGTITPNDMPSTEAEWNKVRCHHALTVLKRRYTGTAAERVFGRCKEVADDFLRLALDREREVDIKAHTSIAVAPTYESEVEEEVDIEILALKSQSSKKYRPTLQAGDTIEYECELFRITKTSQVMKVEPDMEIPLALMNSDIIRRDKLLRRIGSSGHTMQQQQQELTKRRRKEDDGDTQYCALSSFRLIASEETHDKSIHAAMAKETRAALDVIEAETGVMLNTGQGRGRSKKRGRV